MQLAQLYECIGTEQLWFLNSFFLQQINQLPAPFIVTKKDCMRSLISLKIPLNWFVDSTLYQLSCVERV
jgi:hypothetical protein